MRISHLAGMVVTAWVMLAVDIGPAWTPALAVFAGALVMLIYGFDEARRRN